MKISCDVAKDLLPLYAEDICSEDSKRLLQEHLQMCGDCRVQCERMKNAEIFPAENQETAEQSAENCLTAYAKKIRRRRMLLRCLIPILILVLGFGLSLVPETARLMQGRGTEIICDVSELDRYTFTAESARLVVALQTENAGSSIVQLWKAGDTDEPIMIAEINSKESTCIFENLLSGISYRVSIPDIQSGIVTVGSALDFRQAVSMAARELFVPYF